MNSTCTKERQKRLLLAALGSHERELERIRQARITNSLPKKDVEQELSEPFPQKRTLKAKKKWRDTRRE